ncbi:FAD-dependent monooxygenase [Nocardia beijingensis]|uniref:FAD-dependent monooxygenase n=1 Tax=Nocardia beijingensis TaxID=95162 RepID=UPI0033323535
MIENALVVGAGIGGLAAGAALARNGVDVDIVEIRADDHVLGVGINQPGNALRALDALGVLDEVIEAGWPFGGIDYRSNRDERIVYVPSRLGTDRVPANVALTRSALRKILHGAAVTAGVHLHFGTTIEAFHEDETGVRVSFTDGTSRDYDVVAAFDGVRSSMRRRIFGAEHDPVFVGSSGWRVQLPRPSWLHDIVIYQGDQVKAGLIPLSEKLCYLLVVTQEPDNPRYDQTQLTDLLREHLAGFEGPLASLRDQISAGVVYSPFFEGCLPGPWYRGRTIVLGDAAHTMVPHLTQGAAMALEDAVVLAEELRQERSVAESLAAVSELRRERVRFVIAASRAILDSERTVTAANLAETITTMRENLPHHVAAVENILNRDFHSAHSVEAVN